MFQKINFHTFSLKISLLFCFLYLIVTSQAQTQKQFIKQAESATEEGNYYEAIYFYEQALKFSSNKEATYQIALSYYELKEFEKSVPYFEQLLKDFDSYPMASFFLANTQKMLGNYDKAIRYFDTFIANYRAKDFYAQKAIQEKASCFWAKNQTVDKNIAILHFPKPLNTGYSDFSATFIDDKTLQVSALLPKNKEDKKSDFVSQIHFFEKNKKWEKSYLLKSPEVENYTHISNGFFLKEKNRLYFTACENKTNEVRCDIFVAELSSNNWSNIKKLNINDSLFTNSQASAYVNENGQDVLFWVSNKDNDYKYTDIFTATETSYGIFENEAKLPNVINTIDNESTPFFDAATQTLYFSSEWHYGFGGFDIFKSKWENNQWQKPENLGTPLNSSSHDQYFYIQTDSSALFASNRDGALQLRGSACCFDIFEYVLPQETENDSLSPILAENLVKNNQEKNTPSTNPYATDTEIALNEKLPVTIYFHNDEPNPKTTATKTKLSYDDSYKSYSNVRNEYYNFFPDEKALDQFFRNKVDAGYKNLEKFTAELYKALENGKKINLLLEGYCSPLALNDYNINLAKRRIVNVQNFLLRWNDNALQHYFNQGNLIFSIVPFGEERAPKGISDSTEDVQESIYNPKAALERRVAIIEVETF